MLESLTDLLSRLYYKLARPRLALILGAVYLANQVLIASVLGKYGHDLLRLQTTFDPELFRQIISQWGEPGLAAFRAHFYPDSIHPFIYALFLASAWAALTRREDAPPSGVTLAVFALPLAAGFCDLLENCLHILVLQDIAHIPSYMVTAGALAANTKWLLAGVSILAVLAAYARFSMRKREIFTEISIAADPAVIWEILTDLEGYARWNPFIVRSQGKAELGERLTCCPRNPGSKKALRFHPRVSRATPQKEFAWLGRTLVPGLADGEHIFELSPLEDGNIRLVHRMDFKGLLIPIIWKLMAEKTRTGFDMMNRALKEQAEKRAGEKS